MPTNSNSRAGSIPACSAAATIPCSYSASHNSHMGFGVAECQQKNTGPAPIGSMMASSLIFMISRNNGARCSVFRLRMDYNVAKWDSLYEAGSIRRNIAQLPCMHRIRGRTEARARLRSFYRVGPLRAVRTLAS